MSGAVGVIIFIVGLLVSIGLHELGHMYPAKKFGVRVSQYMIGFGPTLWSRVKGETEYGLKAIPLGGYVRIIGMFGPKKETLESQSEANAAELNSAEISLDHKSEPQPSQGLFKSLIAGARAASLAEIRPGEENRAFYLLSAPKKFVVMFGGPFMNLLLACILLTTAVVWVGSPTATTVVNRVVQCLSTPANPDGLLSNDGTCGEGDFSPAHKAGLKPGDKLLEIGGRQVSSWDKLGELLRGNENQFVTVTYQRSTDQVISKRVKIATREVPVYDANGNPTGKTEQVGYLGVTPKILMQGESISTMPSYLWRELGTTFSAILSFPRAVLGMGQTLTSSEPRPADGPVSVVGISQISGDIASSQYATFKDKLGSFLMLFGSLNMFLFAFNMVPILPLDGGHLAGALYEGARRRFAKLRGRPDPGPVDTARMMPLAYVMGLLLIGLAILSILTDLIKPISF